MDKLRILRFINLFNRIHNQYAAVKRSQSMLSGGERLCPTEIHVLVLISVNEDIRISDIAKRLYVTKSAASQVVKKLTSKKFLKKERVADNERMIRLTLSSKGLTAVEDFIDMEAGVFADFLKDMKTLNSERMETIEGFFIRLEKMFDAKLG